MVGMIWTLKLGRLLGRCLLVNTREKESFDYLIDQNGIITSDDGTQMYRRIHRIGFRRWAMSVQDRGTGAYNTRMINGRLAPSWYEYQADDKCKLLAVAYHKDDVNVTIDPSMHDMDDDSFAFTWELL